MKKKMIFLLTFALICGVSFSQTEIKPSTSFTNQITKVNTLIKSIEKYISDSKIDSALILLKQLPNEISGFNFLYTAEATNLTEVHQNQVKELNDNISKLQNRIKSLEDENKALKSDTNKEIVQFIEDFLAKRDLNEKEIEKLKLEKDILNQDKVKLTEAKTYAIGEVSRLSDSIKVLQTENNRLNKDLQSIFSSVKVGLSIGFNGFVNNQLTYIVRADSTVRESGNRSGASGIISAVVAIRLDSLNNNNIIINVPLGDFTSNPNQAMGLFNQRVAVGLGYARRISKVSPNLLFSTSVNISPYEQIDYNEIKGKKMNLTEYTKLNPENFGSTTSYSYSLTIGFVYTFNSTKK